MTQVFIVSEHEPVSGRHRNIGAYELFEHAVNHVQAQFTSLCDKLNWQWVDADGNTHEIAIPNDFASETGRVMDDSIGETRRGVDDLVILVGNRVLEYRVAGLLETYTVELMEVK